MTSSTSRTCSSRDLKMHSRSTPPSPGADPLSRQAGPGPTISFTMCENSALSSLFSLSCTISFSVSYCKIHTPHNSCESIISTDQTNSTNRPVGRTRDCFSRKNLEVSAVKGAADKAGRGGRPQIQAPACLPTIARCRLFSLSDRLIELTRVDEIKR